MSRSGYACLAPLVVISSLLAVGCTMPAEDSKDGTGETDNGASGSGHSEGDPCASACRALTSCGLCIQDNSGMCLSESDCAAYCPGTAGGVDWAYCTLKVQGCDTSGFSSCMGGGSGGGGGNGASGSGHGEGDPCASACRALTNCGLCIQDNSGMCLSESDCAAYCPGTAGGVDWAYCTLSVQGCDTSGFSSCMGGSGGGGGGGSCKDLGAPCGSHEECCTGRCDPSPPYPGCL